VNVVFGPQGRAVIGLPNNITHARLASTGAELTVTWPGPGAQAVTARLDSTTRADIALPAGQQGLIMLERRDDGDGPVYLSWIEPPR